MVPEEDAGFGGSARRVSVEPGGMVTVWIRGGGEPGAARDRRWLGALAEAVLVRQAIFLGVQAERVAVPAWLTVAGAEAVLIRLNPALMDAWCRAVTERGRMPSLRILFAWDGAARPAGDEDLGLAAFGLWKWLRADPAGDSAWRKFLAGLLSGTSPGSSLVRAYDRSFAGVDAPEIELAWQVGIGATARAATLPLMEADASRALLEQADRLVVGLAADAEALRVVSLAEQWMARRDPYLAYERTGRLAWLEASLPRIHPFYRNAAASLGQVLVAQETGDAGAWSAALWDWRRDLATGRELERGSRELLDGAP